MPKYSRNRRSIYKPKGRRISRRYLYEMPMKGGAVPLGEVPAIVDPKMVALQDEEMIPNKTEENMMTETGSEVEKPLPANTDSDESEKTVEPEKTVETENPVTTEEPEKSKGVMGQVYDAITGATAAAKQSFTDTTGELISNPSPTPETPSQVTFTEEPSDTENNFTEEAGFVNTDDKTVIEELKEKLKEIENDKKELQEENRELTNKLLDEKDKHIKILEQTSGISSDADQNANNLSSPDSLEESSEGTDFMSGSDSDSSTDFTQGSNEPENNDNETTIPSVGSENVMQETSNMEEGLSEENPSTNPAPALGPMPAPEQVTTRMQGGKSKRRRRTIRKSKRRYRYVYA